MKDNGDELLRSAGIVLPCAKQFGFYLNALPSGRCERPYGHTGPHTDESVHFLGGRDAEDEARTASVIDRLASLWASNPAPTDASPGSGAAPQPLAATPRDG